MNSPIDSKLLLKAGRSLVVKYDSHIFRSGEVSAALRLLPDCGSLYDQVQSSEAALHQAKKNLDLRTATFIASRDAEATHRKQLLDMCRAAVTAAEVGELTGLRDILIADMNDEASLASRLADEVKSVPVVGSALSDSLLQIRQQLLAKETALRELTSALELATREFGETFYKATGSLAQGKAMLFASGVAVADRKVTKRKKKATPTEPSTQAIAA